MDTLFHPRSVLVVGVSTRADNLGRNIVRNLVDFGFDGEIVLWGRHPGNLFGHRIRTAWEDVPTGLDLAIVLVPAAFVPEALERAGERGVRRAVISTGGFEELGDERLGLQEQVKAVAARHGIRFTGPNCLGLIDTSTGLCTAFVPLTPPPPGRSRIHVLAQSGGVGIFYLGRLAAEHLGYATFVSLGNKLDIDETELLAHLRRESPGLVCLYLEDVRQGRRFFEALTDYPCPVLVHKANVSAAGARAAASHTASMAADDRVIDAALRQAGVVRVRDSQALVNGAKALSLPPMRGDRLAIVSRSGGHAVIAADLSERYRFSLPPLGAETAARIGQAFRAGVIRPTNPLDLGDLFDFDAYVRILEDALTAPDVDGIVFVHIYDPGPERPASRRLVEAVGALVERHGKPIFTCLLSEDAEIAEVRRLYRVPIFASPEEAMVAAAVSRDTHRRRHLPKLPGLREPPLTEPARVAAILAEARAGGQSLLGHEGLALAAAAGFPVAPFGVAKSADEARHLARRVGFPIVLKIASPDISHKSDVGGVVLGLADEDEVATAYTQTMRTVQAAAPDARLEGVLLQRMEPGFREVFLGGRRDPNFGPVVMVGLGGVAVELFRDVALRLAPLTARDIDEMFDEVVSFRALRGVRNLPAADLPFLRDAVARMATLLLAHPEILEIDLNPLKLHREGRGGVVVDARVVI